jgi:flagellar biosynthetic protein FlhB
MQEFIIDLQLFAEEKTEQPTPKRKEDVRKKGQIVQSKELNSAVVLFAVLMILSLTGSRIWTGIVGFFTDVCQYYTVRELTFLTVCELMLSAGILVLRLLAPLAVVCMLSSVVCYYVQSGFTFTMIPVVPKLERLDPSEGIKKIFSKQAFFELVKSLLKLTVVAYAVYTVLMQEKDVFFHLFDMEMIEAAQKVWDILMRMCLKAGFVFLVIGGLDYLYCRREYLQSLLMTKQEVREEMKQLEGDPKIKGRIRQIQRKMSMSRLVQEVPNATVVITNPTHVAVALRYEPEKMNAPVMVAKGEGYAAQRIKDIARRFEVPIVEKPLLARSLFKSTEVGDQIPEELYRAVAEVLAFIYRLKSRVSL